MKRTLVAAFGLVAVIGVARADAASIILNGDFENNTAPGTLFNMGNAQVDATVADVTAFGTAQEIDLVTGLAFGIAPQSGNWKLGMHTQDLGAFDAFSFDLSANVVSGQSYTLSFWAAQSPGLLSGVEIGLSSSATSFGTLIFTANPTSPQAWDQFIHAFVAPVDASFLTVRSSFASGRYVFVDNFSLEAGQQVVPEPATLLMLGAGLAASRLRRKTAKRS